MFKSKHFKISFQGECFLKAHWHTVNYHFITGKNVGDGICLHNCRSIEPSLMRIEWLGTQVGDLLLYIFLYRSTLKSIYIEVYTYTYKLKLLFLKFIRTVEEAKRKLS